MNSCKKLAMKMLCQGKAPTPQLTCFIYFYFPLGVLNGKKSSFESDRTSFFLFLKMWLWVGLFLKVDHFCAFSFFQKIRVFFRNARFAEEYFGDLLYGNGMCYFHSVESAAIKNGEILSPPIPLFVQFWRKRERERSLC